VWYQASEVAAGMRYLDFLDPKEVRRALPYSPASWASRWRRAWPPWSARPGSG